MKVIELEKAKENMLDSVVNFINSFFDKFGRAPSIFEIETALDIAYQTVLNSLFCLHRQNKLYFNSIEGSVVTPHMRENGYEDIVYLEIIGNIPCGLPVCESENHTRVLALSRSLLGPGEFYALVAEGDSMKNAGIENGDIVVIKKTENVLPGSIVVALTDNSESTLKTLAFDEDLNLYFLHPENDKYQDIYAKNITVQGMAVKLIKLNAS